MKRAKQSGKGRKARVVARAQLPTSFGRFTVFGITGRKASEEAVAIQRGTVSRTAGRGKAPLVRVHSQCLTGDVFTSERCDCRAQLEFSLRQIAKQPAGVLLYLPQEGRGIGLLNKLRAYKLQEEGMDTVEANLHLGFPMDKRDYGVGAQILRYLGISKLRLMSNNPRKRAGLLGYGLEIVESVPVEILPNPHNERYLETKRDKLGHEIMKKIGG